MWFRGWTLAPLVAALLCLAGCLESAPRHPLPSNLIEDAHLPGYEDCRIWGDEVSPDFNASLLAKDMQVRAAAQAGRLPEALEKADFLAISGGGDNGAFAPGVLKGWTEKGTRPQFEVVTGVSAGALAAPFAFLGPSYDGALHDIFTKLTAGDLYKSRGPLGYFKDAMNDTSNLRSIISRYVTEDFLDRIGEQYRNGRRILILTTNLDAERPVIWDLTAIASKKRADRRQIFVNVLLASAAVPGVFPPVYFHVVGADGRSYEEMHVDGGVTAQLVFVPAQTKILPIEEKVFGKHRTRRLFLIRNGKITPEYELAEPRAFSIAGRAVATLVKYQVIADLNRLYRYALSNETAFYFCGVPLNFDAIAKVDFDASYVDKLYAAGMQVGTKGLWSTDPPLSPSRYMP